MNQDIQLLKYLATVDKSIGRLYEKLIKELAKVGATIDDFASGAFFSFKDYPQVKEKVEKILDDYSQALEAKITNGMTEAINMSYLANTTFLKDYSKLSDKALKTQRETATKTFIQSRTKSAYGLGLSDKVWNYTQQAKAEFEAGMSELIEDGITAGISAEELGRKLRSKLNNPDMVYRRYHLKKLTATGKKDVVEWRKKVVDEDGKVHFVKTEMDLVGRGVYRSSRKNALRLAATEINMAYRYADNVRWQSEPFIRGIRIRLSGNHTLNGKPFYDICDELQGDYPKSFMWSGWHVKCRCSASPILIPQEEMDKIYKLPEDEYQNYRPKDLITEMPDKFKSWFEQNKDKIEASIERGTQPYFIRDNTNILRKLLGNIQNQSDIDYSRIDGLIRPLFSSMAVRNNNFGIPLASSQDTISILKASAIEYSSVSDIVFSSNLKEGAFSGFDRKTGVLYISDRNLIVGTDKMFNPSLSLRSAMVKIKENKSLSFDEEYAFECVYHEIMHAMAKGWKSKRIPDKSRIMESVNQVCAREYYELFIKKFGLKPEWKDEIKSNGYGYHYSVNKLNEIIDRANIKRSSVVRRLKNIIINNNYDDIKELLINQFKKFGIVNAEEYIMLISLPNS